MFEEELPFRLKGIVKVLLRGHLLPALIEVQGIRDVRIPHGARCCGEGLDPACSQAGDSTAVCTVHVDREEVITPHANTPG